MVNRVPPRSEIPAQYTWDVASVFPSDVAWEAAIAGLRARLRTLARFRGHLGDGPESLVDWLQTVDGLHFELGKIEVYASSLYAVDTTNQAAAARNDRAIALYAQVMAAVAFGEPEMIAIGFDTLRRWMREEPRLTVYAHYIDALEREQAHVRSPEVEELLGQVLDPFETASSTHGILADADLRFRPSYPSDSSGAPIPVAQGNIDALVNDPDREVRRTAWESYADAHLAVRNTMANALAAGIKQDVFIAQAHCYASALEAAVSASFVPVEVYYNVVNTFQRHLPTWHRYWRVRREALGYDQLHVYDIKAPLTTARPQVSLAQSVDWVCEGMRLLGEEYVARMRRGVLEERWVDPLPNIGKKSGAFSSGAPGTHPFVLMSHTEDLESLSTLAHELGHSMHSYYTWQSQPIIYTDYSIFVAEVASNFNQVLVREHLFATHADDRDFQIALIEEAMSNFHRYFFLMPTLARFELETHQRVERDEPLTADGMIDLLAGLFAEGYGDEVVMDHDRMGITWAEFHTHLYSNFYVYQYTTGISAGHALADRVRAGESRAREDYLAFLRAGDSLYPLDALKLAGVDLTTPEPIERAFAYLGRLVDRLEGLVRGA